MRPYSRAIDNVESPVKLPRSITLLLDSGKKSLPDARLAPAVEAASDRPPGAVALRQVTPGGAGAEEPQDAVEDAAMVDRSTSGMRFLGWKQRLKPLPLLLG